MSQMLKSSGAMGIATIISRVLGMVRVMVYASFMGDGVVAAAFQLAFTIPNLFRRLLGEGALTAAFVPVFKEKEREPGGAAWLAANGVLSALLMASAGIAALAVAAISVALMTGTLAAETRLMLQLLRLMFPYMIFVCAAAVLVGMLNARGRFFIPATGPALLNVVMIASVLLLAPRMGERLDEQVFGLAWGVLAAGLAQALIQIPALRREGFRFHFNPRPWRDETVRRVAQRMIPAVLGVAAYQVNIALTQMVAFWYGREGTPILAPFEYAVRLMELPQGVFAISLATYLLPTLSGLAVDKNYGAFRSTLREGLGLVSFINLPMSLALVLLAEPIVRLLFERGEFGPDATARAAMALQFLAPGLIAFSFVNILARAFYALGDVATPMRIAIVCLLVNLVFMALLISPMRQGGLGLANTLSSMLNVWLLGFALRKKLARLELTTLRGQLIRIGIATAFSGLVGWLCLSLWQRRMGHDSLPTRLGEVFVPMAAAGTAYLALAHAMKLPQTRELLRVLSRKRGS